MPISSSNMSLQEGGLIFPGSDSIAFLANYSSQSCGMERLILELIDDKENNRSEGWIYCTFAGKLSTFSQ